MFLSQAKCIWPSVEESCWLHGKGATIWFLSGMMGAGKNIYPAFLFWHYTIPAYTHWAFLEVYKTSPDNAVVRGVDCFYPRFWYEIVQQNLKVPKTHTGKTNHICIFFFRILHWPTSQMGRFRCGLTLLSWLLPLSVIGKIHFFH